MIKKETPKLQYLVKLAGSHTVSFRAGLKVLIWLGVLVHIIIDLDKNGTSVGILEQLSPSFISEGSAASGLLWPEVYDSFMNPKNLGIR